MTILYEHKFQGGTAIRIIDRPFPQAQKEVPTLEIDVIRNNVLQTFFAYLYDNDAKKELAPELYDALYQRYKKEGVTLFKNKICRKCNRNICESCQKITFMEAQLKGAHKSSNKRGRPRKKKNNVLTEHSEAVAIIPDTTNTASVNI